jgi:uncharacterized protein DUF1876
VDVVHVKTWHVDVFISEEDNVTQARAVLTGDRPDVVVATGATRRNPRDPVVPEIGDEVAVGRALEALSVRLLGIADTDIHALVEDSYRAG